jgi:LmbE family N-acetylglucosaminyl deacetylase
MKVLVIAAHPDDEVYGMGGTIAKLASQGDKVYVLIVTDGCTSQYRHSSNLDEILKRKYEEAKRANDVLGVQKIFYGNLPDMRLDITEHIEVNNVIENVVKEIEPDVVYTHFYGDVNLDHQCVYRSTLVAVRPLPGQSVKELYCYRVPSSTEWSPQNSSTTFMPNVYSDISNYFMKKYDAIMQYQTEIKDYPHPRSIECVEKLDFCTGLKCGLASAEEFMLLRKIIL